MTMGRSGEKIEQKAARSGRTILMIDKFDSFMDINSDKDDNQYYRDMLLSLQQLKGVLSQKVNKDLWEEKLKDVVILYDEIMVASKLYLDDHAGYRWTVRGKKRYEAMKNINKMAKIEKDKLIEGQSKIDSSLIGEGSIALQDILRASQEQGAVPIYSDKATRGSSQTNIKLPTPEALHSKFKKLKTEDNPKKLSNQKDKIENQKKIFENNAIERLKMKYEETRNTYNVTDEYLTNISNPASEKEFLDKVLTVIGNNAIDQNIQTEYNKRVLSSFLKVIDIRKAQLDMKIRDNKFSTVQMATANRKGEIIGNMIDVQQDAEREVHRLMILDRETSKGGDLIGGSLSGNDLVIHNAMMDYDEMSLEDLINASESEGVKEFQDRAGKGSNIYDNNHGYIHTGNAMKINQFLRGVPGSENLLSEKDKDTLTDMDAATKSYELKKDTILYRVANPNFLEFNLGIKTGIGVRQSGGGFTEETYSQLLELVGRKTGTVVGDKGYMSAGIKVDNPFKEFPLLMTLLCPAGTKCFPTDNYEEGELIFPRNTELELVGVKKHSKQEGKLVPITNMLQRKGADGKEGSVHDSVIKSENITTPEKIHDLRKQYAKDLHATGYFCGLELVFKVSNGKN